LQAPFKIFALLSMMQTAAAAADSQFIAEADKANALQIAALQGDVKKVTSLLAQGVRGATQPDDWSPLMYAVASGNLEVVRAMLAYKPNFEYAAKDGTTALLMAARIANAEAMQLLLDAGAVATAPNESATPALIAWKNHCYRCVLQSQFPHRLKFDPLVLEAQQALAIVGFPIVIDGYPSLPFWTALWDFQRETKLPPTALLTSQTMVALRQVRRADTEIDPATWFEPPRLDSVSGPFTTTNCDKSPPEAGIFTSEIASTVTVTNASDRVAMLYAYDFSLKVILEAVEISAKSKVSVPVFAGQLFAINSAAGRCLASGFVQEGDQTHFIFR
jgi:hypothetical protein